MLASEGEDGQRKLERLVTERLEQAVALGRERLAQGAGLRAVLALDGYITLPAGKTDAVFVEGRDYAQSGGAVRFEIAVPYRNASAAGGFAVYRPKLVAVPQGADLQPLMSAFWAGVDSHEQAAKVWNEKMDQSQ